MNKEYEQNGFYGPVSFLSKEEIEYYTSELMHAVDTMDIMNSRYRCKSNVLFPWIDQLSRHPTIIDHLQAVLGPNIHCWDALIWIKDAKSEKYVSWHQDATYWNFLPKEQGTTIWITLSGATPEMGCIEYIRGSHKEQRHHIDVQNENNLLMRGQTIENMEEADIVQVPASAGSFIMHHPYIFHGSAANVSEIPRLAIGLIYASTEVKPIVSYAVESTVMVAGVDEFNHMLHDPSPTGTWQNNIQTWNTAYERQHNNYYKMEQLV